MPYGCYRLTNQMGMTLPDGACWLNPRPQIDAGPPPDAGPPSATVGNPCQADVDCATPGNTSTFCFRPILPDGGASQFPDGYCSATCQSSEVCSTDMSASCITLGQAPNQLDACLKQCPQNETDGGQNSCRVGYACLPVTNATFGVCF